MPKPSPTSHSAYFQKYIDQVPEEDLQAAFQKQSSIITDFLHSVTEEKSNYAYAPGKWTGKELLQHITDTERIFAYRGLCIARNEKNSLPGFDENDYAAASNASSRSWKDLAEEFLIVRKSTEALFNSFTPEILSHSGISNNNPMSVSSAGFIAVGHVYHHIKIFNERYL
jgi:DinB superfamily